VTVALTLETLTTLGVHRKLSYHILALRVSSGVSVWVRLLPSFRNDPTLLRKSEGGFYVLSWLACLLKGLYLVRVNEQSSLDV